MSERSIFLAALDKATPEKRCAFLDEVCAGNVELRRQVEALIREHEGAGSFLSKPAADLTTIKPSLAQPEGDGPGSRVGPYKLLQQIGEGGFGMVYMAEQEHPVRRRVALKIVKPGMDSLQIIARFEAERQALAMMDHQNIARVFDAGTTPTGRPYFVMELVHGIPITKYCDDNHLSPRERLELFIPICQAIQHAHQKGIIHRDVKPSNVLVTLYDGRPVPKVIDFGVAKAIEQRLTERTMFTQYGSIVGTFEYMAPEQAEMSALGVDTRSDIYSLGVLLYELLTGTTPLEHKRLQQAAYSEVLRMIKEDEPPKPSTRISSSVNLPAVAAARKTEPTRLARQMQGELDWIVMKCLEKDRARRYETANGLARDLHRYLHDEPVEACPPSAGYKLRKFASKYQKWLAVAGAFVFVLVAGTAISMFQAVRASLAQAEARKERDTAAKALAQAEAVIQFLAKDLLGQANPERNERGQKVTVEELLMKAADRIENQPRLAEQPEVEATLRLVIGNSLHKLGQPRSAQPHLSRAVSLRRQALGPDHPATLTAQEDYVFFLLEEGLGDLKENAGLSRATWEARSRVLGPEHVDTLDSLDTYCGALNHLGLDEEAEPLRRKCLETMRRVLGPKHPKTLQAMSNLGWSLIEQGNYADAEPIIDNCLQLEIEVLGPRHPETLPTRNNLGLCRMYLERFTEAEATLREALSISRESSGPNSKQSLFLESVLTRALSGAGKWDEAEELGRNALAGRREILPAGNVHIGQSLVVLGLVLVAKGKLAEADALLREALSIFRDKTDQDQWVAQAEVGRGTALAALGQFNDSEALLSSARSRFTHDRRIPPWQKRQSAEMLAQIYEQAGKINQAASWRTNPANETSK